MRLNSHRISFGLVLVRNWGDNSLSQPAADSSPGRGAFARCGGVTSQALRASSPSRGAFWVGVFTGAGSRIHLDEPQIIGLVMQLVGGSLVLVANKPPLLGEVARRSRDGGVGGLCYAEIPGF